MTHAYDELYLKKARSLLAGSLDYAVNTLHYKPTEFYSMFLKCDLCDRFESGDPFLIAGHSGIELALLVIEKITGENNYIPPTSLTASKSREYWCGWALAFYQWYSSISLRQLEKTVPINDILCMYDKYHEMDILHFVERLNELRQQTRLSTYLKELRQLHALSQNDLSQITGIPLKTLQHYEQGTKSLTKANVSYVLSLAHALNCPPEQLLE